MYISDMKELDKTKAYDLRDLNDEQLTELLNWLKDNDNEWVYSFNTLKNVMFVGFSENSKSWGFGSIPEEIVNALTLFEPQLKVGDTFEHEGFICRVEEPIKKWYYNTRTDKYVRTKYYGKHLTEITDQEFIKQLEKHAR